MLENVTFKRPLWVRDNKLDIEIIQEENKMMIVPQDRRKELTGKALDTLSYATCNINKATRVDEKEIMTFSRTIKNSLTKLEKESKAPFYAKLDTKFPHILTSGPIFRGVKSILESEGIFYALIRLTDEAVKMFEVTGKFIINPVVADMAIQTAHTSGVK